MTPTGGFGGPITVAVNQSHALRERGHEIHIAGAASGYTQGPPSDVSGIPAHLFTAHNLVPGSGFAGLVSAGLYRWFRRNHSSFDAIHFHLSRSLTTLPLARIAQRSGTRYVTQTHGMIDATRKLLAVPLDAVYTRPALRGAGSRFFLTPRERLDLQDVIGPAALLDYLPNGVPISLVAENEGKPEAGIEVLYLARLHKRKRPATFVEVAQRLSKVFSTARFSLVGPDEGEGATVDDLIRRGKRSIDDDQIAWEGALSPDRTLDRMSHASIYVLPSVDEPFPMSVLEAMSLGIPVIVTDSCGLAGAIQRAGAGIVVDSTTYALEEAIRRLLSDGEMRRAMGQAARHMVTQDFSMGAVVGRLEASYRGEL
ncbi:glycosyltransferase [Labedella endophytica]|uniref:Glycosyltransferase n=1 Tax=Labedella endophytica TaxID=1523160 RepID=A0A3S0XNA8_9MICO|nr:glycosyltransferase [Labedella endophytica]RUR01230.1 glycosyltransferase [Labedella endophytica]